MDISVNSTYTLINIVCFGDASIIGRPQSRTPGKPQAHCLRDGQGNIPRTVSWRRSARTRCVASAGPTGTRQYGPCGVRVPVEITKSQSELAAMSLRF
jgi:hypothetical protein